jgi:8-oxo-dGTP diphosphatase
MPPERKILLGVGCIVQHPTTRDLLMLQRYGTGEFSSEGAGTWSIPGGWLEFGEDSIDAAAREVLEETGVFVDPIRELRSTKTFTNSGEYHVFTQFVECRYLSGVPTVTEPDKCRNVGWVNLSNIWALPLFKPFAAFWNEMRIA